jgi:ABC-type cobalamin/Fe3+-siderophores transport system ATPase subunit
MSRLETRQLFAAVPDRVLFQALDFKVEPGQSWGVLGPNGAGKTTLLHTLAGLRSIQHGEVILDGKPLERSAAAGHLGCLSGLGAGDGFDRTSSTPGTLGLGEL